MRGVHVRAPCPPCRPCALHGALRWRGGCIRPYQHVAGVCGMLLYRYGAGGTVGQWRRSSVVGAAPRALVLAKRARRPSALEERTLCTHTAQRTQRRSTTARTPHGGRRSRMEGARHRRPSIEDIGLDNDLPGQDGATICEGQGRAHRRPRARPGPPLARSPISPPTVICRGTRAGAADAAARRHPFSQRAAAGLHLGPAAGPALGSWAPPPLHQQHGHQAAAAFIK